MDQKNIEYFRERENAEQAAAERAASEAARKVHEELARKYAALSKRAKA